LSLPNVANGDPEGWFVKHSGQSQQNDSSYGFRRNPIRFYPANGSWEAEGVAITHWHTELFKCWRDLELCDLHNRQKLG